MSARAAATTSAPSVTAVAPGKVILLGEHAVNRGQPAIAAAVGLYARCRAAYSEDGLFHFRSAARAQDVSPEEVWGVCGGVREALERKHLGKIRAITAADFYAPQKYVLGTMQMHDRIRPLTIEWDSQVPSHSGLGSGGSAFTSMVAAVLALTGTLASREARAEWAHLGDVVAHGGIASALDTQTSLLGGVIRYTGQGLAASLPFAAALALVIGDTGVHAATREVNARVRAWLDASTTARMHAFRAVGALTRAAGPTLERGDWDELGRLMNLNQLVLEKIGVSCPEADRLIAAALDAGALGAKVSGSGGGGIIVALATPGTRQAVAQAISAAGGTALTPAVAVPGVALMKEQPSQ
jgi:mevalonate kinase